MTLCWSPALPCQWVGEMDTDETGKPICTKGKIGRECGRYLCQCSPARWRDGLSGEYVCEGCALEENAREWRNRPDGSPRCIRDEIEPEPQPVPITGYYEDPYDNMWPSI